MQIIWDRNAVEELKKKHTVLELETFDVKGQQVTTWCVVPTQKIGLGGFSQLKNYVELHGAFIKAYNEQNYKLCMDISEHLMGQFGGELDTFYEEITSRIKKLSDD
jgi:hypothetical protein